MKISVISWVTVVGTANAAVSAACVLHGGKTICQVEVSGNKDVIIFFLTKLCISQILSVVITLPD